MAGSLEDIDRVCDEFERRYRAGELPRIEEFLDHAPAADQAALVLELVAVDVCFRRLALQSPQPADYVARFPRFEPEILELFASESSESISRGVTMRSGRGTRSRSATATRWTSPTAVGRYRLVSLLGQGGFGEVWKGIDTELQRTVAVKLMRADLGDTPELAALFVSEGRKLAQLRHPGVVTVFDVGQADGRCFIVSELIDGGTLAARFRSGAFAPSDAAQLVAKIADALHHAHLQGLIHRDIKPQNILLSATGEPKLADFGLAANEEDQLVEAPGSMGTLAYMSPEAMRGASHHTDARADIYSLGVVLYQALTGRLPFVAHSSEQYREQVLNREARPPRTIDDRIPPELERICLKCLKRDLHDRYTTAADLARELRSAATTEPPVLPPAPPRQKNWPPYVVAALLLMLIGGAVSLALISWWSKPAGIPIAPQHSGKGVAENVEALAYDESSPGFQRTPFQWRRLLDRSVPQKLAWTSNDANSLFLHHPDRSELVLSKTGLGMVALGRVTVPAYRIQIDLHQQQWAGRFGVFFGYHAEESDPAQVRYQTITFERIGGGGPILCRQLCSQRIESPEEVGPPSAKQLSRASVRLDDSSAKPLELEVSGKALKVRWAGQEIKELSEDAFQAVTPADQVGYFGVYLFSANGLARDARVMARKVQ